MWGIRKPLVVQSVRLLQPELVVEQRTTSSDISALVQAVQAAVSAAADSTAQAAVVAVAIRPGRRCRLWTEFIGGAVALNTQMDDAISKSLASPDVTDLVSFVVYLARGPAEIPEVPQAWRAVFEAATAPMQVPDDVVALLWPEGSVSPMR
jgi:hypothetical protein